MATKKAAKHALPPIFYVEMEEDSDGSVYPLTYNSLAEAADGNLETPVTIGTYKLIEIQKVKATFQIVK